MKSPRIALALAALGLVVAACEKTPTGGARPGAARFNEDSTASTSPPSPPPDDTTGRGGGYKGSGG